MFFVMPDLIRHPGCFSGRDSGFRRNDRAETTGEERTLTGYRLFRILRAKTREENSHETRCFGHPQITGGC